VNVIYPDDAVWILSDLTSDSVFGTHLDPGR
jgi:calcineurin-like phosphoesterase family protein